MKSIFLFLQKFALVQIYVMTFIFVITWQFAQFALFLHSVVCFIFASAQLLHKDQVRILLTLFTNTLQTLTILLTGLTCVLFSLL